MKRLYYIPILCMLLAATNFYSCKDDSRERPTGITSQSWQENKPLEITAGEELVLSFNANDDWTATTNSNWCNILNKAGKAGQNTMRILVTTTTDKPRTASITIRVKSYYSTSFQISQNQNGGNVSEDMEVNIQVDRYLKEKYLWNDEYKTLKLDYTKNYKDFLFSALEGMKTNTLEKRESIDEEGNPQYTLFSYIQKNNKISSSRDAKLVPKNLEYSYGITGISESFNLDGGYDFYIQGVYPDSPAAKAGFKRGTAITRINGEKLTGANAPAYYSELISPVSSSTLQITGIDDEQTSITSTAMYINPILLKQVEEINGHKIGYLAYNKFDAAFDEELFEAFKYFKSQNITDLILDIRYNQGGHALSANLMSSCIAGASAANKVFSNFRYNATRMRTMSNKAREEKFMYNNYENLGTSLAAGDLGLTRLYCLTGYYTGSASELVINSLRGIDVEVILIGKRTHGKNVGMEFVDITTKRNTYRLAPITFQTYNAKGFGAYETGFMPDLDIHENNPYQEEEVFYIPREYGSHEEFLYAAAIKMISGVDILPRQTRHATKRTIKGKEMKLQAPVRLGFNGILKIPTE